MAYTPEIQRLTYQELVDEIERLGKLNAARINELNAQKAAEAGREYIEREFVPDKLEHEFMADWAMEIVADPHMHYLEALAEVQRCKRYEIWGMMEDRRDGDRRARHIMGAYYKALAYCVRSLEGAELSIATTRKGWMKALEAGDEMAEFLDDFVGRLQWLYNLRRLDAMGKFRDSSSE